MKSLLVSLFTFVASLAYANTNLSLMIARKTPIASVAASGVIENGKLVSNSCDALNTKNTTYTFQRVESGDYQCVPLVDYKVDVAPADIDVGVEMSVEGIQNFFISKVQQNEELSRRLVLNQQPVCPLINGTIDVSNCKCQSEYLQFNSDTKTCDVKSNMVFIPYSTCGGSVGYMEPVWGYIAKPVNKSGGMIAMCMLDIEKREVVPHPLLFKILFFIDARQFLVKHLGLKEVGDIQLRISQQEINDLEAWVATQTPDSYFKNDLVNVTRLIQDLRKEVRPYELRGMIYVE